MFFQRRQTDGQQAHEKMLNITNHQGNANQNHNEISPHTCQNSCHQKDKKCVDENVEEKRTPRIPSGTVGGNVDWCSHYGKEKQNSHMVQKSHSQVYIQREP